MFQIGPEWDVGFGKPQAKMVQDFLDDCLVLDEADDPHGLLTFGAGERVNFIDSSDQPGPILPIRP